MPAKVVIVHDDDALLTQTKAALEQKGFDVAIFVDPMAALPALDNARLADLLITRVNFGPGKPHGVALALMARNRRPKIKVLFVTRPENRQHTEGLGELLPAPATVEDVVAAAERLLSGGTAAPLLMAPQRASRQWPAAAPSATSAPVVQFSARTNALLQRARQATERACRALQSARAARSAHNAPLTWCAQPTPL